MDPLVIIPVGFAILIGLILCGIFWESRRSSAMISNWAETHGYQVVEKKQPLINLGPYRWENPRGRSFYSITVRSRDGQIHRGWVSCGVEYLGLFVNRIEICWDKSGPLEAASETSPVDESVWPPPPTK